MKNLNIFIFLLVCSFAAAQPVLNFETNSLKAGEDNPMTICEYMPAGSEGENVSWDFTQLKSVKDFTGLMNEALELDFSEANTELEEFGVRFYYKVDDSGIEQYGYSKNAGNTKVIYNQPFVKMRFPFSYQDENSANFSGDYFVNEEKIGSIEGNGEIVADAWGTITLPGDIKYDNTLRVKATKKYTTTYENSVQNVEMVTYRWYNSFHRYPLLVLIETAVGSENTNASKSTKAAYNLNAVKNNPTDISSTNSTFSDILLYPNPVSEELTLKIFAKSESLARISITDLSGRNILPPIKKDISLGLNTIYIHEGINSLKEGLYIISIKTDGQTITKEFPIVR